MIPRSRTKWPAVKPRIRRRGFAVRICRGGGDIRRQRSILPPLTMRWRLSVRSLRAVATPLAERPAGSLRRVHAHRYRAGVSLRAFGVRSAAKALTASTPTTERIERRLFRAAAGVSVRAFRARSAVGAPIASARTTERIERRLLRMARPSEQVTASPLEAVPASVISTRLVAVLSQRRDRIFGNLVPPDPARRSAVPTSATELRQVIERSYHWSERAAAVLPSPFPAAGVMRGWPSSSGRRHASPRPDTSPPNRSAPVFQEALGARPDIHRGMVQAVPSSSIRGYRRHDDAPLAAKRSVEAVPIVWRRAVADRAPGPDRQATPADPETGADIGRQAAARSKAAPPASIDAPTSPATGRPGPASRPQTVLDAALIDRLTVSIIGRIDRRARIERERRGL
jgi:hypothetical protein